MIKEKRKYWPGFKAMVAPVTIQGHKKNDWNRILTRNLISRHGHIGFPVSSN